MSAPRGPQPSGSATPVRLAYLNSHYPALSHTFIQREVEALRERGLEIHTFSVRPFNEQGGLLSASMQREFETTKVLLDGDVRGWVSAHLGVFLRHPVAWARTLAKALRSGHSTLRGRVWQVFYFGESVVLYTAMRAKGLRHVHVHHANVGGDVARLACHLGTLIDGADTWRWSITIHGSAEFEYPEQWDVANKVREASRVSAISDFCRAQLMRLVEVEHWDKIEKVHMAVDPARFAPDGVREHDGPLRLLAVGRLVDLKGFPMLVDAVAELNRRGIPTEARIVGSGPIADKLQRTIERRGLADRVTLMGPIGEDDIVEQYRWADVFVSASFLEGLPVVLMEAMATAMPVISTQVGAVSELIEEGESGLVIPPARADALVEAIAHLVEIGPSGRAAMGERARAKVLAEFTPATTGPAMEALIRSAMGR